MVFVEARSEGTVLHPGQNAEPKLSAVLASSLHRKCLKAGQDEEDSEDDSDDGEAASELDSNGGASAT